MIFTRLSINLLASMAVILTVTSCGGEKKKSQSELDAEAQVYEAAEQQLLDEIDKVVHDMPPPSEVPYLLMATGADFNKDLVNDLGNAEKYYSSADKSAMNLGAYSTDIGYLSSYDQVQDAMQYMESCQKLADKIGISSAFELDFMERFEKNLGNKDSLANLLNLAMDVAERKLEALDKLQMVALVLSGSYIEGLYLSCMVLDTYPEDLLPEAQRNLVLEPLVRLIIDQREPLNDVVVLLKDLESDPIIAQVIAEFDILKVLYDTDLADVEERISSGDKSLVLSKDMLADVILEVKRIRGEMVE